MPKASTPFPIANQRLMERTMTALGEQLAAGKITADQFDARMRAELKDGLVAQYRFAKGGALDAADQDTVNRILETQHEYLKGLRSQVSDGTQAAEGIANRASMYAGSATEAQLLGKLSGTEDSVELTWQTSGIACAICSGLAGTTKTAKEWRDAGQKPGTIHVSCHCRLG